MKTIIDARNAIGDTIYMIKPLDEFLFDKQTDDVILIVNKSERVDSQIVRRSFSKWTSRFQVGLLDTVEEFKSYKEKYPEAQFINLSAPYIAGRWCYPNLTQGDLAHISNGYSRELNIGCLRDITPIAPWSYNFGSSPPTRDYILIAPYSASCSRNRGSRPNKTVDWDKWKVILDQFRGENIYVFVPPTVSTSSMKLDIDESHCIGALDLYGFQKWVHHSKFVLTIDNGVCHVASIMGKETVILWPRITAVNFISPIWSSSTRLVHMEPIDTPGEDMRRGVEVSLKSLGL